MRPVLFTWGRIRVYSYPAMLYLGLVFGITAGNYMANLTGQDTARAYAATILLLIPALAGARLVFVALHWNVYQAHTERIWRRSDGGMSMYGGLPLSLPLSVPLLSALGLGFGAFWDVAGVTMLVGLILTRIGCFLNGCCAGRPSIGRFALCLPNHDGTNVRRIPTQLFESAWGAVVLLTGLSVREHLPIQGELFVFILGMYAAGRSLLEFCREHTADRRWMGTLERAFSPVLAALAFGFLTLWIVRGRIGN